MHPELARFTLLGAERTLYSYPLCITAAIVVGTALAVRLARRDGIARWDMLSVGLVAWAAGLVGAVLLHLAVSAEARRALLAGPALPGMVWYGGLLGGGAGALAIVRRFKLPLGAVGDAAAPALPLAHAVGRVGCLLAGCCYGAPARAPWPGVVFHDPAAPAFVLSGGLAPLHPVQLYEAGGLALLGGALLLGRRAARLRGQLLPAYLVGYALLRTLTELARGDTARGGLGPLSTSQLISGLLLLVAYVLSRACRQKSWR